MMAQRTIRRDDRLIYLREVAMKAGHPSVVNLLEAMLIASRHNATKTHDIQILASRLLKAFQEYDNAKSIAAQFGNIQDGLYWKVASDKFNDVLSVVDSVTEMYQNWWGDAS